MDNALFYKLKLIINRIIHGTRIVPILNLKI
jgi:hypothetical protein